MVAGKNMTVKQESNGKVTYATASNVTFDSVQFGDNGPKITNMVEISMLVQRQEHRLRLQA